jgi:hypothetical protein
MDEELERGKKFPEEGYGPDRQGSGDRLSREHRSISG